MASRKTLLYSGENPSVIDAQKSGLVMSEESQWFSDPGRGRDDAEFYVHNLLLLFRVEKKVAGNRNNGRKNRRI